MALSRVVVGLQGGNLEVIEVVDGVYIRINVISKTEDLSFAAIPSVHTSSPEKGVRNLTAQKLIFNEESE